MARLRTTRMNGRDNRLGLNIEGPMRRNDKDILQLSGAILRFIYYKDDVVIRASMTKSYRYQASA